MAGPAAFREMPCIGPEVLEVLDGLGFTRATPVQEATIPLFSGHKVGIYGWHSTSKVPPPAATRF